MTMALVRHEPTDSVRIDDLGRVLDFARRPGEGRWTYSGVGVVSPELLERMNPGDPAELVPILESAMADGMEVSGWTAAPGTAWHDLGTPERYLAFHRDVLAGQLPGIATGHGPWRVDTELPTDVVLEDWGWIGSDCQVGEGARLARCVLWDGASIAPGSVISDRIIAPWAEASIR